MFTPMTNLIRKCLPMEDNIFSFQAKERRLRGQTHAGPNPLSLSRNKTGPRYWQVGLSDCSNDDH